ncbi:MAG: RluA family pseudouridine synthase [Proteobacteria bacterium]|nr:RluA family pseudouridine synthase [Pseudomonadota bacterium]
MLASHQPLTQVQQIVICENHAGQRIDNFLSTFLRGVPKSRIYRIIRKGEVRVNKGRIAVSYRLVKGDTIRVPPIRMSLKEEENHHPGAKLSQVLVQAILYEDDQLLVINKPAGLAVHGGSGVSLGLIEAIRGMRPDAPFLELVHRLDRETSGCVMIAKTRAMLTHLHNCLKEGKIEKHYFALVHGKWKGGKSVDAPLHKFVLKSGERRVKVDPEGKASKTLFEVIENLEEATLLRATPMTGRTHQIRVHCQFMGHPICGDEKYGFAEQGPATDKRCNRLFLHAHQLVIDLPYKPYQLIITCPMPEGFEKYCQNLRK